MTSVIFLLLSMGWAMNLTELTFSYTRSEKSRDSNSLEEFIEIKGNEAAIGDRRGGYQPGGRGDMPPSVYKINDEKLKSIVLLIQKYGFTKNHSEAPEAPEHNRESHPGMTNRSYSLRLAYTADKKPVRVDFFMSFNGPHGPDAYRDQPLYKKLSEFRGELESLIRRD